MSLPPMDLVPIHAETARMGRAASPANGQRTGPAQMQML